MTEEQFKTIRAAWARLGQAESAQYHAAQSVKQMCEEWSVSPETTARVVELVMADRNGELEAARAAVEAL